MPADMADAVFFDAVMQRWPGYTISSLLDEDAQLLYQFWDLVTNDDLGKAE